MNPETLSESVDFQFLERIERELDQNITRDFLCFNRRKQGEVGEKETIDKYQYNGWLYPIP